MGLSCKISNPFSLLRAQANDNSKTTSVTQNTNNVPSPRMALGMNPSAQGNNLRRQYAQTNNQVRRNPQ
jgi:hypothetical protein